MEKSQAFADGQIDVMHLARRVDGLLLLRVLASHPSDCAQCPETIIFVCGLRCECVDQRGYW